MDRKTRFFKNAVILQFIPLVLLVLLIVSNFREQKVLKIRQLHPYEFNYGELLPLIFFAVCCIAALFALFPKTPDAPEDEAEIVKLKRKQNFWKFAFYCNVFLLFVIGMFSILVFQKEPLIIDQPVYFYTIIFSRFLLIVIISLVVASFLLAASIYWKTNKSMAMVILIFSFLILTASSIFEFVFVSVFIENSERHFIAKAQKQAEGNQEEVYEDYDESEEGDDESEDATSSLYDSWNFLIEKYGGTEGKENFFNVKKDIYFTQRDLHFDSDHEDQYYLIKFIENLRYKPDELYSEFETFKPVFYSAVSEETYHKAHFDKIVNGLLLSYDDVGGKTDKLNEMYKTLIDPAEPGLLTKYDSDISDITVDKIRDLDPSNEYLDRDSYEIAWFYSFWARRNNEGNIKEVALILKEIKEYYDENSEE